MDIVIVQYTTPLSARVVRTQTDNCVSVGNLAAYFWVISHFILKEEDKHEVKSRLLQNVYLQSADSSVTDYWFDNGNS